METNEHILLFSSVIHVRDRTVLNARLMVPLALAADVPLTAFRLRVVDNDTGLEVGFSNVSCVLSLQMEVASWILLICKHVFTCSEQTPV